MPELHVRTAHSDYVIDTEAQTIVRVQREARAAEHPHFDEAQTYTVLDLEVGRPLYAETASGRWVRSTPVEAIREVHSAD